MVSICKHQWQSGGRSFIISRVGHFAIRLRLSKMGLALWCAEGEKRFEKGLDRVTLICYSIIVDRVTRRRQDGTHDTTR